MSCAGVLYRLVAYLQFIYGHLLLPESSEILLPWNCCFLESASSVAGTKLPVSHALLRSGVSEAVFLSFGAAILLCRLWEPTADPTPIFTRCTALYNKQGEDLTLATPSPKGEQVVVKPEGSLQLRTAGRNQGIELVLGPKQRALTACNNVVAREVNSFIPEETGNC